MLHEQVLKLLKLADSEDLWETMMTYPDNEREGRTDIQLLADELSWLLYKWTTNGWLPYEELKYARYTLRTSNDELDILIAKSIVDEYKRLCNLKRKLERRGVHGKY